MRNRFRRLTAAFALVTVATLTAAGCSSSSASSSSESDSASASQTLTIANSGELTSFDPAQAVDGLLVNYFQPVFDTLMRKQPDGTVVPMLATKWAYNDDLTELTLTLRDDVTFTDGTKFDADAAVANLQHQKDTDGPNSSSIASVDTITATDPTTVVLKLSTPDPGLLDALATTIGIMASPTSLTSADLATNPVGSGPYTLVADETVAGDTYTYQANPNYWDKDLIKYGTIVIKTMTDATARINAIKSGQVQGTPLDLTQNDEATAASGVTVQSSRDDWSGLMIYDRAGTIVPALGDQRVRQAIAYAIDSDSLIAAFRAGHAEATDQIFNTESQAYVADLDDAFPYDVAKAKELMAEAGYADGFTVTIPDLSSLFGSELFAAVQQQLAAIGVTVQLDSLPIPELVQRSLSGQYAMALTGGGMGTDWNTVNSFFLPTSLFNPLHSTDPTLDALIQTIRTTTGDEQAAAYQKLNEFIVDQQWATPFYRDDQIYASTDDVQVQLQYGNIVPYIYNYSPKSS